MDDVKKGTQLLEVYALEIQMYTEQKNSKKLKTLYEQSLHIKSAIPHPLIMGVIRGEKEGERRKGGEGEEERRRGEVRRKGREEGEGRREGKGRKKGRRGEREGRKMGKRKEEKTGKRRGEGRGRGKGKEEGKRRVEEKRREEVHVYMYSQQPSLPPPPREAGRNLGMRNSNRRGEKDRGTMQGGKRGRRWGTTFWRVRDGLA